MAKIARRHPTLLDPPSRRLVKPKCSTTTRSRSLLRHKKEEATIDSGGKCSYGSNVGSLKSGPRPPQITLEDYFNYLDKTAVRHGGRRVLKGIAQANESARASSLMQSMCDDPLSTRYAKI